MKGSLGLTGEGSRLFACGRVQPPVRTRCEPAHGVVQGWAGLVAALFFSCLHQWDFFPNLVVLTGGSTSAGSLCVLELVH